MTAKRKPGRPPISTTQEGRKHTVVLPHDVIEYLRTAGGGSISRGIMKLIAPQTPPTAKRAR